MSFTAEGADLVFSGSIVCIGADSAAITVLRLTPVVPPGEPTEAPLDASASCGPCTADDAVHAEGRVLAEPGLYEIHMETEITGNGATQRPSRTVQFAYLGTGDPVRVG